MYKLALALMLSTAAAFQAPRVRTGVRDPPSFFFWKTVSENA